MDAEPPPAADQPPPAADQPPPAPAGPDQEFAKLFKFATLFQRAGKRSAARRLYADALRLRPDDPRANFNLGALLSSADGDPDAALAAFRRAAAAEPAGPVAADAHANVAGLLLKRGELAGALEACEAALARDALCEPAVMNLGNVLRRLGRQPEAIERCWAAMEAAQEGFSRPAAAAAEVPPADEDADADAPLTVVCVKWGSKYGPEYANRLAAAVRRHLAAPHAFVCLTDDAAGLDGALVEARALPAGWTGWWNKVALFDPAVAAAFPDRVLYIDLDTVIVGPLDALAGYRGAFGTLGTDAMANELRRGGLNSSLMAWDARAPPPLVHGPLRAHFALVSRFLYKFDHWLEMTLGPGVDLLDERFPGHVIEYAQTCAGRAAPPAGARLVCFPLRPKPHECEEGWLRRAWCVGDGSGVGGVGDGVGAAGAGDGDGSGVGDGVGEGEACQQNRAD